MPAADPTAERLRAELLRLGRAWPAELEHFESLGSTNDHLKQRAADGAPAWTACLADVQAAGRGRQGAAWASPRGGLYLSVLLRPAWPRERLALVPLLGGVAVARALVARGLPARIKWPNDVLVDDRKIAGVLAEASSLEQAVFVVLGIGVNVDADPPIEQQEARARPTSLRAVTGRESDLVSLAAAILAALAEGYAMLESEGATELLRSWRALSVGWWGGQVEVRSAGEVLRGIARDVDESGALCLELADGRQARVVAGEARWLRLRPGAGGRE